MKNNSDTSHPVTEKVLLEFARQVAKTDAYKKARQDILDGEHPSPEVLFDIAVAGSPDIPKDELRLLERHIALCPICSEEFFKVRMTERAIQGVTEKILSWQSIVSHLKASIELMMKCFVRRSRLTGKILEAPQGKTPRSYKVLSDELTETEDFRSGDSVAIHVEASRDGYLAAFGQEDDSESLSLVYPTDSSSVVRTSAHDIKELRFRIPSVESEYRLIVVCSDDLLLDPHEVNFSDITKDSALQAFAELLSRGEIGDSERDVSVRAFKVESVTQTEPQQTQTVDDRKVLALRVTDKSDDSWQFWQSELFTELQEGRARFGWGAEGCDLVQIEWMVGHEQTLSPDQENALEKARFMKRLSPGDRLVYVNMPTQGEFTIVEVTGPYEFTHVWDELGRGDYRHMVPVDFVGVFEKQSSAVSSELLRSLSRRGRVWDLTSMRDSVNEIVALIRDA